jgi:hypothetical protein
MSEMDIRLLVSFKGHRKRKRLKRLVGPEATDYLIDLWLTVRQDRPEGILEGWDEIDIAIAAGWPDDRDPKELVDALIDAKWLDFENGIYSLHDWDEHQGWACGENRRKEAARKAARAKWKKRLGESSDDADDMRTQCDRNATAEKGQCEGNADAGENPCGRNAPSPSPFPSPIPTPVGKRKNTKKKKSQLISYPSWLDTDLWDEFKKYRRQIKAPLTDHAEKCLIAELRKLHDAGEDPKAVINQTIVSGKWTGLFPIRNRSPGRLTHWKSNEERNRDAVEGFLNEQQ